MKPSLVTFTGVDQQTDIAVLTALSTRYPIEWGVLFSPKRQGSDNRYPDLKLLDQINDPIVRLSAHLCGRYSEDILNGVTLELDLTRFRRAQINTVHPDADAIMAFGQERNLEVIAQHRDTEFPDNDSICWLFDRSGGRGDAPEEWPSHPGADRLVGYAGGLNPDNVMDQLDRMDTSGRFWIDMESGIRTDDWLDLDKCRRVCEAIWG